MTTILSAADLVTLVADLVAAGTRVIAPVASKGWDRAEYRPIRRLDEAALGAPLPRRSLKEFFLPPTEVLLRYRQKKDGVELQEVPTTFAPQVILGASPCDAAGIATLDAVMGWDYRDELWFGRRDATTVVSLACAGVDGLCFCGAVGLGPDATRGSDVQLVPFERAAGPSPAAPRYAEQLRPAVDAFLLDSEPFPGAAASSGGEAAPRGTRLASGYLARALTARGEALLEGRGRPATETDLARADAYVRGAGETAGKALGGRAVDGEVRAWLAANFDHPLWRSLALRCHGCGACAAVCPTCHCFDIVDEHDSWDRGARRRNWDFCQSAKFTLHASTHNPRATQTERIRQRVVHKFSIYPARFDQVLCTGCGRCARACAAGMNLPEILGQIVQLAGADAPRSGR